MLAKEVLGLLSPREGENYLDLTAGYGGHARLVLAATHASSVLVDRDASAIRKLKAFSGAKVIHQDFLAASRELADAGEKFDMILADLGVSSMHLNDMSRGFSFKFDGPLDMRMDVDQKLMAVDVLNGYSESRLADIIREYGQEPKSEMLARLIVKNRPLKTTDELAKLAKRAWPGQSKVHPATRLFQAIRIEVNDELKQLEQVLPLCLELLKPGGRLVIISFHSLEDRLVKNFLADHSVGYDRQLDLLTKKPVTASSTEIAFNPRSRSAKLRAAVKIKIRSG